LSLSQYFVGRGKRKTHQRRRVQKAQAQNKSFWLLVKGLKIKESKRRRKMEQEKKGKE
jgi:hypothetical protein